MFRRLWILLSTLPAALAVGVLAADPPSAPPKREIVADPRGGSVVKGELIVTLQPGVKEETLVAVLERFEAKAEIIDRLPALNQFTLRTDHARLHELRQRLANHPLVASAAVNSLSDSHQAAVVVKAKANDPVFDKPADKLVDGENWNLYRIKAPQAWETTRGGALVAVVDSGTKTDHEEVTGKSRPQVTFAPNADAGSGLKRLRSPNGGTYEGEVRDHGTHVAVTAAGTADNRLGTAGIAPASPLLPIQSLYYFPPGQGETLGKISGPRQQLIAGIERAVNEGAAVVNCSFGGNYDQAVFDRWKAAKTDEERWAVERELLPAVVEEMNAYAPVLDLANRRGTIVVVSAGNQDMPAHLYALCLSQRVIVVGAIDSKDQRYQFSNHGPYVHVCAPGVDVYSGLARETRDRGFYGTMTGTSMAAPHVTGVVALMKTIDPGLKHADVVDILMSTGERLNTITADRWVGPLVNAEAAVAETKRRRDRGVPRQPEPPPLTPQPPVNPQPPAPVQPPVQPVQPVQPPVQPIDIELPPNPITWIEQPDPWNNVYVQQIIQVWLSIAMPVAPVNAPPGGVWVYNQFGQVINVSVSFTVQQPVWVSFRYRWLWENSLLLQSSNMGTLYEFVFGTLRQGRINYTAPRVPAQVRPTPTDPQPRPGGLPFDPTLRNTRWKGVNQKTEVIEFSFGQEVAEVVRASKTVRYRVVLNTYVSPMTIDLIPDDGKGDTLVGLVQVTPQGELLLRTDFTKTRPTTVSRGDPLTYVLKRTDVEIATPGATADGVQMPPLFRGAETLIRGLDHPAKPKEKAAWGDAGMPTVHTYALSGDGKRVWVVLVKANEKELKDRVQLWSMNTAGGDAKQAEFGWPDAQGQRLEHVLTNHDGSVAWIYTRVNAAGGAGGHAYLQTVTPGGTAKKVAYTADIKGVNVLLGCIDPRITADGKSLYAITDLGVTRFDADGHHHVVADRKHITFGKAALSDYSAGLSQLVISADGSHWAAFAWFQGERGKEPQAVLYGTPKGVEQISLANPDGTFDACTRLSLSDDGKTLLYQRSNAKTGRTIYLHRQGVSELVRSDLGSVSAGLISPDGRTLYATARTNGAEFPAVAFTQDLATGRRQRVMTGAVPTRWDTWWKLEDIRYVQQSRDGATMIATPDGGYGLYVYRGGVEPTAEQPTIKSVRQRYDGNKLRITIELTAPDKLGEVSLIPTKDGYLPAWLAVAREKNALSGMGFGARAYPVDKRPGVYEVVVTAGPELAQLDGSYSFRVVVANADKTQATFHDYQVLR